tara:strand:- start:677 stop:1741 length:1065 start_codon:yes stop_codon:yes gene_type:complete
MKYLNLKFKNISKLYENFIFDLKNIVIKYALNNFRNKKCYEYDKSIFCRASADNFKLDYKKMDEDELKAFITFYYHKVEKGLSIEKVKPNFGARSKVICTVLEITEYYLNKFGSDDPLMISVYQSIKDYYLWHKDRNIEIEENSVNEFLKKNEYFELKKNDPKYGGSILLKKKDTFAKIKNSYEDFFSTRRSVRMFSKDPLDNNLIIKCIDNALIGTPSICNRNINKVYVIEEYSKRKQILALQNGNSGFGLQAPKLLVVTSKLNCYFSPTERREPYIAGGMFSMSLVYALHASSIACCCLNWDVLPEKDIRLKNILKIKHETIIMLILVGHYKNEYKVAVSKKQPLKKIVKFY